jgi:predicted ATPase
MDASLPSSRHLERVEWSPNPYESPDLNAWPFAIPAVAQLRDEGSFDIPPGVTVLIGENGSGKSTLVEAFAASYPRRGFVSPFVKVTGPEPSAEDSPLSKHLKARTARGASPAGFFLRAEAMHAYLADIDADPTQRRAWGGERLQARSHGESFLAVLRQRFADVGMYFMDEPEAALSFRSCLGLISLLDQVRREGSQVVVATHSPLLASLPDATLIELGDWGMRHVPDYDDLEMVQSWRSFLDAPPRYLKHLLER